MVPVDRVKNVQTVDVGTAPGCFGFYFPYDFGKTSCGVDVALGFVRSFYGADLAFAKPYGCWIGLRADISRGLCCDVRADYRGSSLARRHISALDFLSEMFWIGIEVGALAVIFLGLRRPGVLCVFLILRRIKIVYDRRNVSGGAAIYIVYEGHCVMQEHCSSNMSMLSDTKALLPFRPIVKEKF